MTMTPDDLVAGPRGRRFCLEWVLACEDAEVARLGDAFWDTPGKGSGNVSGEAPTTLRKMLFDAEVSEDSSRLFVAVESRVWLPAFLGRLRAAHLTRLARRRADSAEPPSSAEMAGALRGIPRATPDGLALLRALARAADNARYWQPADVEDRILALPELREGLLEVAASVLASPAASWWDTGIVREDQWAQTFVDLAERPLFPVRRAAEVLEAWRAGIARTEESHRTWYAEHPGERLSGSWWSIEGFELASTTRRVAGVAGVGGTGGAGAAGGGGGAGGREPFGLWCVEDSMGPEELVTQEVAVPRGSRVLEIVDEGDWVDLCHRFPLDVTWSRRGCWEEFTDWRGAWVIPDWLAVSGEWDAVHLTVSAWLSAAGRVLDLGEGRASMIAGWDPDRTFWLRDVVPVGGTLTWEREDGPDLSWRTLTP